MLELREPFNRVCGALLGTDRDCFHVFEVVFVVRAPPETFLYLMERKMRARLHSVCRVPFVEQCKLVSHSSRILSYFYLVFATAVPFRVHYEDKLVCPFLTEYCSLCRQ